jgi:hypothetical protein
MGSALYKACFIQTVAENFSAHFDHPPPLVDATGSGKGFKLFCSGVGFQHPDANATARLVFPGPLAVQRRIVGVSVMCALLFAARGLSKIP